MPYSADHSFSQLVSEAFTDIGEYCFITPIKSQPWCCRSRVVARIRIFEKYLKNDDVIRASWIQKQAEIETPGWRSDDAGIIYINDLLEKRSNGMWRGEISSMAENLPTDLDFAKEVFGYPTEAEFSEIRAKEKRAQFRLVKDC